MHNVEPHARQNQEKPHMILEGIEDQNEREFVKDLEVRINKEAGRFLLLLSSPEAAATYRAQRAEVGKQQEDMPADADDLARLTFYFRYGYGREVDFDDGTEAKINDDTVISQFISNKSRANSERELEIRNRILERRLQIFIAEVARAQGGTVTEDQLLVTE